MTDEPKIVIGRANVPAEFPIFVCDLAAHSTQLDLARQALAELQTSVPDSTPSNVKAAYMSPWKSHALNTKLVPLCQTVASLGQYCAKLLAGRDLASMNLGLAVTDCWCAIYEDNDSAIRHNHFPADFAAVAYLEAEENCAPLVFAGKQSVQPKPGMLILFPGLLDHEVPPTAGRRTVVAFNMHKTAEIR